MGLLPKKFPGKFGESFDIAPQSSGTDLRLNSRANVAVYGCWSDRRLWNQCRCQCDDGLYGPLSSAPDGLPIPRMPRLHR